MTESVHVYTATLLGSPNRALSLRSGSVQLDETTAPHVQSRVEIAVPDQATLSALDPRMSPPPRVRIVAAATIGSVSQTRTFDLTLRERSAGQVSGTVQLELASDEALVIDYKPLVDVDLWGYQGSLRSLVNAVLARVGLASLQPGTDVNLTSYWDTENRLLNPGGEGASIAPWMGVGGAQPPVRSSDVARTGSYSVGVVSTQASPVQVSPVDFAVGIPVAANKLHSLSVWARQFGATPVRSIRCAIRWVDQDGFSPAPDAVGDPVAMNNTAWQRASVTAKAPAWAVRCVVFYTITGGTASGQITYLDDAMFNEGRLTDAFNGDTPDTTLYRYDWASGAHASSSRRTPLVSSPTPDAFVLTAGQSALEFLAPLVQAAGRRLVCDELRRWTLRDSEYVAPGSLSIRYAVNMVDGQDSISRGDDLWFDAAITVYTWTDASGVQQTQTEAWALTPNFTRAVRFDRETAYPGPGFSEYVVRRAQGRGREVTATAVSDWNAAAEQPIQIVLDGAPTQIGRTSRVVFDLSRDEMTVTTRSTDTPFGAIDLLPGTIDSLAGTIDNL